MVEGFRAVAATTVCLGLLVGCHVGGSGGGSSGEFFRGQAFKRVQEHVQQRLEHRVHWKQGLPEDEQVAQLIEQMLRKPLTVDDAVQIALFNNASLQAEYEELGISQAGVVEAGLLSNPVFFASARFPDVSPSATNLEFDIAKEFLDLLLMAARKRMAEANLETAQLRVTQQVLDMVWQVQEAYYNLVGALQVAAMQQLVVQAGQASADLAQRMHEAGNISDLQLARERNSFEQVYVQSAQAQAHVAEAKEQLTRLMGLWSQQAPWKTVDRLPDVPLQELPLEDLELLAVAWRADLQSAAKQTQLLTEALRIARDGRWFVGTEVGVSTERDSDRQWVTGPNLKLQIPIFDQGQARIARLESQLRQSRQHAAALEVNIRSEVRSLTARLQSQRQLAQRYRDVVIPLREQVVHLTQQQYNYMLVGVFDLILAKQQEFDAYQAYIEAVRDYWIIRAQLQQAVGGRLPSEAFEKIQDSAQSTAATRESSEGIQIPAAPPEAPQVPEVSPVPTNDQHEHHHHQAD